MSDRALALPVTLVLASLSLACGEKGDGSADQTGGAAGTSTSSGGTFSTGGSLGSGGTGGGSGGSGGAIEPMSLYSFDTTAEGFMWEVYVPDDTAYTNVGETSTLAWDGGDGANGAAGRLMLTMPFDGPNQLADIQINPASADWTGRTIRADVMIESGFSPDPSAPGGAYIFAKTTANYVWGRGTPINLPPESMGTWVTLAFELDDPNQSNTGFSAAEVVSLGIQFFTGMGSTVGDPTETVAYVDEFRLE